MLPGFSDGQTLYFQASLKLGSNIEGLVGKIVLIERESYPGIFFIKRVTLIDQRGIWVQGDNEGASTDSRQWGFLTPEEIIGVALKQAPR
jgi:hypothetical protein